MRLRSSVVLSVALVLASAVSAASAPLRPDEARRFVAGKLFAYSCFEGTRGLGRIFPDGSVVGTVQPAGKPVRFVALPAGTVRISSSSICASVRGLAFSPCFNVDQTSAQSFRGSLSGLGFAYCDFVRQNPRTRVTASGTSTGTPAGAPTVTGSAASTSPVSAATPVPASSSIVATPLPQAIDLRGTTQEPPAPQPAVVARDN